MRSPDEESTPEEVQRHLLNNAAASLAPLTAAREAAATLASSTGYTTDTGDFDNIPPHPPFSVVKKSELGIGERSTSFVNITVSETAKRFVDLPDALRRSLVPIVKVYKTYVGASGEQVDLRIRTDPNNNGTSRVELERIDFTRKGGNPAEIDTNIQFNISLSARELGFYFKKQYPMSEQGRNDLFTLERESKGVAWIDLIKVDPGRELEVGEAGNSELVLNETDARMKVLLGYAEPTIKPSGISDPEWSYWKESIASQKEVFYLNLFKHQFDFKSSGEVGLSIDFIASGNGRMLVPEADILLGPRYKSRLSDIEEDIKRAERRIANEPIIGDDIPESDYRTCVEQQISANSGSLDAFETQREYILALSKRRLLNQLELGEINPNEDDDVDTRLNTIRDKFVGRSEGTTWTLGSPQYEVSYEKANIQTLSVLTSGTGADNRELQAFDSDMINSYVYLGDIIESALELLAHNGLLGEEKDKNDVSSANQSTYLHMPGNSLDRQYRFLYPFNKYASNDSRRVKTIKEYGGIILGDISYDAPDGSPTICSLLELPVSYRLFESWWDNKVDNKTVFYFKDFINSLLKDFVTDMVFSDAVYGIGGEDDDIHKPEFSINSIPLPLSAVERLITNATKTTITTEEYEDAISSEATDANADTFDLSSVLLIQQARDETARITPSVPNLLWGQATRGILESVQFQREDIPGYNEARLFASRTSTANNLMLREKYNTSIEMVGNTAFLPGSQLFLDPRPLDLGFTSEQGSLARSLGLGGLYVVNYVDQQIDFIKNSWTTKLDTKWESYGDSTGGDDASASLVESCALESRFSTNAQRIQQSIVLDGERARQRDIEAAERSSALYVETYAETAETAEPVGIESVIEVPQ